MTTPCIENFSETLRKSKVNVGGIFLICLQTSPCLCCFNICFKRNLGHFLWLEAGHCTHWPQSLSIEQCWVGAGDGWGGDCSSECVTPSLPPPSGPPVPRLSWAVSDERGVSGYKTRIADTDTPCMLVTRLTDIWAWWPLLWWSPASPVIAQQQCPVSGPAISHKIPAPSSSCNHTHSCTEKKVTKNLGVEVVTTWQDPSNLVISLLALLPRPPWATWGWGPTTPWSTSWRSGPTGTARRGISRTTTSSRHSQRRSYPSGTWGWSWSVQIKEDSRGTNINQFGDQWNELND